MRNVNKVLLVGNVSRIPQIKELPSGQPITTFGVATNRYFTTKSGEKKSVTEFHNIVTWGALAKRCFETLKKGKLVYIEGYLKTKAFDMEDGKRSFRTEIVAYNLIILSKREAESNFTATQEEEEMPAIEEILDTSPPSSGENNMF